jgi:hypothetical protein
MYKWIVYVDSMGRLSRTGVVWADTKGQAIRIATAMWGEPGTHFCVLQDVNLQGAR